MKALNFNDHFLIRYREIEMIFETFRSGYEKVKYKFKHGVKMKKHLQQAFLELQKAKKLVDKGGKFRWEENYDTNAGIILAFDKEYKEFGKLAEEERKRLKKRFGITPGEFSKLNTKSSMKKHKKEHSPAKTLFKVIIPRKHNKLAYQR